MFRLKTYKNQKINISLLTQIIFYAFPLTFIIGNFAVSLSTLIFICISLFLIKSKHLSFRFTNSQWILIFFFSYLFILTTVQFEYPGLLWNSIAVDIEEGLGIVPKRENWYKINGNPLLKSFLQIRFLILIFVIDTLFFNKILDLRKFLLSSLICTTFTSLDILLQYITGIDIFGLKTEWKYNTGPFGNEKIAGTYLKNFSFFSIFYIFYTFKKHKLLNLILIFIITLHLTSTLLAGNRMPLILFMFGAVLVVLLIKNLRFVTSISLVIFISIFFILSKNDPLIKSSYERFYANINISKIINYDKKNKQNQEESTKKYDSDKINKNIVLFRQSGHNRVFRTAIEIFKESPFIGFGLKSFRIKCVSVLIKDSRKNLEETQKVSCGNHPHNYYLELLSEVGIIGLLLIISFILILLKNSFGYLKKHNKQNDLDIILVLPAVIVFILEVWPIKSTGSFFTTWNATFFWINAGILIAFTRKN